MFDDLNPFDHAITELKIMIQNSRQKFFDRQRGRRR